MVRSLFGSPAALRLVTFSSRLLTAGPDSTSGNHTYCYSQFWEGPTIMSQLGCAISPFTQTVQSTYTGQKTSAGGSGTPKSSPSAASSVSALPTATSTSAPSSTSGSTFSSFNTGLSTSTIIYIVVGVVFFCALIIALLGSYRRYISRPQPLPPLNQFQPVGSQFQAGGPFQPVGGQFDQVPPGCIRSTGTSSVGMPLDDITPSDSASQVYTMSNARSSRLEPSELWSDFPRPARGI